MYIIVISQTAIKVVNIKLIGKIISNDFSVLFLFKQLATNESILKRWKTIQRLQSTQILFGALIYKNLPVDFINREHWSISFAQFQLHFK